MEKDALFFLDHEKHFVQRETNISHYPGQTIFTVRYGGGSLLCWGFSAAVIKEAPETWWGDDKS